MSAKPNLKGRCLNCGKRLAKGDSRASQAARILRLCGVCYRTMSTRAEFRTMAMASGISALARDAANLRTRRFAVRHRSDKCKSILAEIEATKTDVENWVSSVKAFLGFETEIHGRLRDLRRAVLKSATENISELRRAKREIQEEAKLAEEHRITEEEEDDA